MCGIAGIIGSEKPVEAQVRAMTAALTHRGPDRDGYWSGEKASLGFRRLCIIDLSQKADQPMISADRRHVIVFNGEIYNFRSLAAELKDYPFQSHSDTEVLLAAWQKWGEGCLERLNGMFAFAVWDTASRSLFMARDRMGIKPLYYCVKGKSISFASEIRAVLKSGLAEARIDGAGLADYLRHGTVHAPHTILEDMDMLEPGHWLKWKDGEVNTGRYWILGSRLPGNISYPEACREVRRLLSESVRRQLVADVPVGVFLSGGIDSSAVTGLMAGEGPVNTFSISFGEQEFNEAVYSGVVAAKFGTKHHEIRVTPQEMTGLLPGVLAAMDHPSIDGVNSYIVSKHTKAAGATVALSGLGGDELFGGYSSVFGRIERFNRYRWLWKLPPPVRRVAGMLNYTLGPGVASGKILQLVSGPDPSLSALYGIIRQIFLERDLRRILNLGKPERTTLRDAGPNNMAPISRASALEMRYYLPGVLLRDTDQMSMSHSLEVRVPFLDHELVSFMLSLDDRFKQPIGSKKLLIDALAGLLPTEILNRPKMGFVFPWKHWLKSELKQFCSERIYNLSARSGVFNRKELLRLWSGFLEGDREVPWTKVWALVVLENWMENNKIGL